LFKSGGAGHFGNRVTVDSDKGCRGIRYEHSWHQGWRANGGDAVILALVTQRRQLLKDVVLPSRFRLFLTLAASIQKVFVSEEDPGITQTKVQVRISPLS